MYYTTGEGSSDNEVRGTNMDEQLKLLAVQNWTAAIDFSIKSEMEPCFFAYKSLFHLIEPYEFENKKTLLDLTGTLTEFVQNFKLTNSQTKINRMTKVMLSKQQYTFEQLLGVYMSELPKAYHSLNLWFKSVKMSVDYDIMISEKNFNSKNSAITEKKKELSKLSSVELLKLFSINEIHRAYSRHRYDIAIPAAEDKEVLHN